MVEIKFNVKPVTYKCPFAKKWVLLLPVRITQIDNGMTFMIVWRCNMANCMVTDCKYSIPNVKGGKNE